MNELQTKKEQFPAFLMQEKELIDVLRSSLYPGAQDSSIKLVVAYCKAGNLDPMQKPVHIVPMWDSKSKTNRDVIMPGIGLYRTQAVRTNAYAGVSDAEYGPDITETLGGVTITYPEWCRVTVKRMLACSSIASFSATERWKENYAEKGGAERSKAPNAMWAKRPYAQLSKCAEAQALRKAFPEVGAQPIEEEIQEKIINPIESVVESGPDFNETMTSIEKMNVSDFKNIDPNQFNDEQKKQLRAAMTARKKAINLQNTVKTLDINDLKNSEVVTEAVEDVIAKDWEKAINECGDGATLTALLAEMPEKAKLVYEDMINDKFDAFIG